MAKRAKSLGKERAVFKLFGGRTQNPVGSATFFGKSWKKANAAGRRYLRNVAAGFYDATGFHPLRASADYDPVRTGEAGRPRPYGTKRPRSKAAQKKYLARRRKRK